LLQFEISPPLVLEISILVIWWLTEMLVVEELYKEAVVGTNRKLIIFNGELDRIRSGCILQHVWRFPYALVNFFLLMLITLFYIIFYGKILHFDKHFSQQMRSCADCA
jgi:hypothetical protein